MSAHLLIPPSTSTATAESSSGNVPVSILDLQTVSSTLTINTAGIIKDINVKVNITHTYVSDLVISLVAPDSTTVVLANRVGSSGQNFVNTVFDQQAATAISAAAAPFTGSFIPSGNLSTLNGKSQAGVWTLTVQDAAGADVGSLTGWSLIIEYYTTPYTFKWDIVPRNSTIVSSSGSWDTTTYNWTPDGGFHNVAWINNKIAEFDGSATVTIPSDVVCRGITVASGSVAVTKSGAGILTLDNAIMTNAGSGAFNNLTFSSGTVTISGTYSSSSTFGITASSTAVLNINSSAHLPILSTSNITSGSVSIASGATLTIGIPSFGSSLKGATGLGNVAIRAGSVSSTRFYTNSYSGNTALQATGSPAVYVMATNPFGNGVGTVTCSTSTHYIQTDTTSSNVIIPNPIVLSNTTQMDASLGTGGITCSGVISGTGNLTKVLGGVLTLSNTGNTATGSLSPGSIAGTLNIASWAGPIPLNVGSVVITNSCTSGNISTANATGTLTINSGVIFQVSQTSNATITNRITGPGTLRKAGASTLTLNNTLNDVGSIILLVGTVAVSNLSIGTGELRFNGGTFSVTAGNLTFTNPVNMFSVGTLNTTQTTAQTTTFSGVISNSGNLTINTQGDITNTGGGAAGLGVSFTNVANTYTGNITVNTGLINKTPTSSFGTGSITLNGGGIVDAGSATTSNNIVIGASGGTIRLYNGVGSTFSGIFSGSGTLSKTDAGTFGMSNTASTFTGNILVKAGTLRGIGSVQGATGCYGAANTAATKIQLTSGAVFDNNGMGAGGGNDIRYGLTIVGTGISGSCWINSGTSASLSQVQTPNITLSGAATIGSVTGATGNQAMLAGGYGTTNLTLGTNILTKTGSNQISLINTTVSSTLAASNIVIAGGTIATDNNSTGSFSAPNATITLNNTAGVVLACSRNASIGRLVTTSGTAASITIASGFVITVGSANALYTSTITNLSGAGGLTLTGVNNNKMFNNTYTGPTVFNTTGIIRATSSTNAPFGTSSGITVSTSTTLATDSDGATGLTISVPISINTGITLTLDGGFFPITLSGGISGAGNVECDSVGSVTISGTNTFTGTLQTSTGAASNLLVNGTTDAACVVTSRSLATLGGSGTINGPVTANSGAFIMGGTGDNNAGTLTCANGITLSTGGSLKVNIGSVNTVSLIAVTGDITLNSNAVTFQATPLDAGTYNIMLYTGSVTGTLATPTLTGTGRTFTSYSYSAGIISVTLA